MKRLTIFFILLAVGIVLSYLSELKMINILSGLVRVGLYGIFGLAFLYTCYRFIRDKIQKKPSSKRQPLLVGLLIIPVFFFVHYLVDTDGGKRKLLSGNYDKHLITFDLFQDNTFKLLQVSIFSCRYYRGTYQLYNDTLRLYNDDLKHLFRSLTFIEKESTDKKKFFEEYLPGYLPDSGAKLVIDEDRRY